MPMGSFYGAELCELVGLFILNNISSIFTAGRYGLYRDDGLAVVRKTRRCNLIKAEALIKNKMKTIGFDITIESGAHTTDFLDVALDLQLNTFHPFKKPNSKTLYVNRHSNHPPHITKAIPRMVHQRLCRLSKDLAAFSGHSSEHINELERSGYETRDLSFKKPDKKKKKKRKRKIFYYHPPFCKSVQTNFGKVFRRLVERHFTPDHHLYKIFNKNTLKISYSCLPNIKSIIAAHNKKLIGKDPTGGGASAPKCNCKRKAECPLEGKCLTKNIVYMAIVTVPSSNTACRVYVGSTSQTFKQRLYKHTASFKKEDPNNTTTLSRYINKLQKNNTEYKIKWSTIRQSNQFKRSTRFCTLCNLEKMAIALAEKKTLLNSRNELVSKCVHNVSLFFTSVAKRNRRNILAHV